jgi:hypothetical protein
MGKLLDGYHICLLLRAVFEYEALLRLTPYKYHIDRTVVTVP